MAEAAKKQGRTNFAVACSLLSQYIKEKGSVADLGLDIARDATRGKPESFFPPTTMSLLPGADASGGEDRERGTQWWELFSQGNAAPEVARETQRSQLTIFCGGKVLVFDNFPAEKAKDLMQLASKGNSSAQISTLPFHQNSALVAEAANLIGSAQPSLSDLPIARKASLQRFLEKRKDRINAKAPYQVASVKKQDSESWIGLAPQLSTPNLSRGCSR